MPLAQLDRVFGYEPKGQGFESLRAHHIETLVTIVVARVLFLFRAGFVLPGIGGEAEGYNFFISH